jgi:hypothetical protein
MSELVKTQFPGFKKDKKHNVVINTDIRQYEDYVRQLNKSKQFKQMQQEINDLKQLVLTLLPKPGTSTT